MIHFFCRSVFVIQIGLLFCCYDRSEAGSGVDIAGNASLAGFAKKYNKSNQQARIISRKDLFIFIYLDLGIRDQNLIDTDLCLL